MTETNFKHTDLGLIPHDWDVKTIGDIAEYRRGSFPQPYGLPEWYGGVDAMPFVQVADVGDDFRLNQTTKQTISKKAQEYSVFVPKNSVLVTLQGSIGRVAITQYDSYVDRTLAIFQHYNIPMANNYFAHQLSKKFAIEREKAPGGIIKTITKEAFTEFELPLPPTLAEQERIAGALSSIDTLIGALSEQIEKKRHIKQGTMQQLLTGKKRLEGFTGAWKSVKLDDLLAYEQPTRYLVQSTEYTEQGTPVLTAGKTFILGYTTEGCGIFDKLPVIIFDDFVVESKYVTFPFKVKSSAMKMLSLRDKANNLRFIYEKMQCIDFPIADHKRHWISEYSQIEITLPEPAEQSAIAAVLSRMDTEIAALEQKRDKYIAIKSGMMQNLLTGKIRLV